MAVEFFSKLANFFVMSIAPSLAHCIKENDGVVRAISLSGAGKQRGVGESKTRFEVEVVLSPKKRGLGTSPKGIIWHL